MLKHILTDNDPWSVRTTFSEEERLICKAAGVTTRCLSAHTLWERSSQLWRYIPNSAVHKRHKVAYEQAASREPEQGIGIVQHDQGEDEPWLEK